MTERIRAKLRDRRDAVRAEWANLRHNRMLLISCIALSIIPILYGGFFLGSVWDPYGSTEHLPVAVVNEDQGAVLNGNFVQIGQQTVDNLKHNHSMKWEFVSADEATKGLNDGAYYMRITIPRDFSAKAATVTTSSPQQSVVEYTTTPSRNFVGSVISNQAAQQVVRSVSAKVSTAYVSAVMAQVGELGTGLSQASAGAAALHGGSDRLAGGLAAYTRGVGQLSAGADSLQNGLSQLHAGSVALTDGLLQLQKRLPAKNQVDQLIAGTKQVQNGMNTLAAQVSANNPEAVKLAAEITKESQMLTSNLTQLSVTLAPLDPAQCPVYITNSAASFSKVECKLAALKQRVAAVGVGAAAEVDSVAADVVALQSRQGELVKSAAESGARLKTHLENLQFTITKQQQALRAGVSTLNTGVNTLSPNLVSALNGYTTLSRGSVQLSNGAAVLTQGLADARSGSSRLSSGVKQLTVNSGALTDGSAQLASATSELSGKLAKAANQLALQPTGDQTVRQIVSPVAANHHVQGDVPNYGNALSPYVLSLGLFVGALAFCVIYPIRGFYSMPKNARSWWLAKISVLALESVAQALVLDAVMVFGLGLHVAHPAQFVGLSIVTSLTFMSIVALLAIALDNVGRFLAMLLLVLQLGSAEGVFPISLSPALFQAINPFVPMTYSIRAFREAISGGLGQDMFWQSISILTIFLVAANILLVVFLRCHGMKHFKHEATQAS
ncbi:YhgE/Pip domain-containing protein [TM7 phylum sp. oral taxon 349]|nr:YhgE/Pip domain-containing protein [TM7 phylum sp. oral taxon 349]